MLLVSILFLCSRIIWLGDLNYRISLSYRSAKALVEMRNWKALLEKDQVARQITFHLQEILVLSEHLQEIYSFKAASDRTKMWPGISGLE